MSIEQQIENNMGLVILVVNRFSPKNEEERDLYIQAGRIGLWKAIEKFNPKLGELTTIAYYSIKWEILKEIKRMLRKNGKLLLFVPFEKERRYRHFNPGEPNHHLYSWNVQTMGNLVIDMGFTIMQGNIREFGYDRFAAVRAVKLGLGQTGYRLIRKIIHLIKPASEVRIIAKKE